MTAPAFAYIDRDDEFAAAVARWRRCDVVGIDTEFIRTRTFFPIPALYQVATDEEFAIVDPLRVSDWREFKSLLEDPTVVKVMHACSEDLEVFARHLAAAPKNLFDTQIASGFLTTVFSPSYADLVQRHTGVELGKHETRSDWLARPLRDEQLRYAVRRRPASADDLSRAGRRDCSVWVAARGSTRRSRDRVGFSLIDPRAVLSERPQSVALRRTPAWVDCSCCVRGGKAMRARRICRAAT